MLTLIHTKEFEHKKIKKPVEYVDN